MGGLSNGKAASTAVLNEVKSEIESGASKGIIDIPSALNRANDKVNEFHTDGLSGSTCTVVVYDSTSRVYNAYHVGDSRFYLILSDGSHRQVTTDDTGYVKYLAQGREIKPENVTNLKSSLTNAIGVHTGIHVTGYHGLADGASDLLLCSDGFWHAVEENLVTISHESLKDLESIIGSIKSLGERDNITAVVASLED